MADKVRVLAIPGIALLAQFAMQLSGYENPTLAAVLLVIIVLWGGWALLTWTPFRRYLPQIQVRAPQAIQEGRARRGIAARAATAVLNSQDKTSAYRAAMRKLIRRHYLAENPTGLSQEQREWQPAPKWYGDKLVGELGVPPEDEYA